MLVRNIPNTQKCIKMGKWFDKLTILGKMGSLG
jgi:hypothetical protein